MTDPLARVVSGERFTPKSETWNAFIESAKRERAGRKIADVPDPAAFEEYVWYWGKLTMDLAAPICDGFADATFATVDVWLPDETLDVFPQEFVRTDNTDLQGLFVVNRDRQQKGKKGAMCRFHRGHGEWSFTWVGLPDCSSSSSSSSSGGSGSSGSTSTSGGCGCITVVTAVDCVDGDISVDFGQAARCCS